MIKILEDMLINFKNELLNDEKVNLERENAKKSLLIMHQYYGEYEPSRLEKIRYQFYNLLKKIIPKKYL